MDFSEGTKAKAPHACEFLCNEPGSVNVAYVSRSRRAQCPVVLPSCCVSATRDRGIHPASWLQYPMKPQHRKSSRRCTILLVPPRLFRLLQHACFFRRNQILQLRPFRIFPRRAVNRRPFFITIFRIAAFWSMSWCLRPLPIHLCLSKRHHRLPYVASEAP